MNTEADSYRLHPDTTSADADISSAQSGLGTLTSTQFFFCSWISTRLHSLHFGGLSLSSVLHARSRTSLSSSTGSRAALVTSLQNTEHRGPFDSLEPFYSLPNCRVDDTEAKQESQGTSTR